MSRTFRRKNYEQVLKGSSWRSRGWKTNGYYTESDREYYRYYDGDKLVSGYYTEEFRPMTEHERGKEYWRIHGDTNNCHYWNSPGPWFRRDQQKVHRQHARQELIKFFKNPDEYEVMVYDKHYLPYWD